MVKWWMVRAGDDNELVPKWIKNNVVSIGWAELGDPFLCSSKSVLLERANEVYTEDSPGRRRSGASQVWRFSHEISEGDRIITYQKDVREYRIGTVISDYAHDPTLVSSYYPNVIGVKWEEKTIARDLLSQKAKNSLGSILTLFRIDEWSGELQKHLEGKVEEAKDVVEEESDQDIIFEDFFQKGLSMIQDKVDNLDPWEMQRLVAGLLVAMDYTVNESGKGPDGGVDVLAHKDAFGFEKPIIKVQVKHRKSTASAPEVQQLLGAHPIGESALFVSTGGFTSKAIEVAKQHNVKLLDLEQLVSMIVKWYETMPNETRSLLPLRKMYVPE
ncbi:restriction endonuclease [Shouchella lehensis]|uniref:Restriction endonuclease n=1 Tax=Shouchella lehensis G1 TaxID=1246626 RepID=A0A060M214_9BACI|nr:restriction endonuclease [Shouchella lehensis]AIC96497.1 restriction endonuclease [Shouchella lehensis G1]